MRNKITKMDLSAAFSALEELDYGTCEKSGPKIYKRVFAEDLSTGAGFNRLFEDYYDVENEDDMAQAAEDREEDINAAKLDQIQKIVDLDATTVDQIKPSYAGKLVIQCPQCMDTFFKDESEIERDSEDPNMCNVNEPCQHCGNISGFEIMGKVGNAEPAPTEETDLDLEDETALDDQVDENELDLDFADEDEDEFDEEVAEGEQEEANDDLDLDLDLDLDEDEMEESFNSQTGMTLHEEKLTESKLTEDASDVMHAYAEDDKYKTGLWFMISYVNPEKKEVEVTEPFKKEEAQKVINQVKAKGLKPRGAYFISDGSLGIANEDDLKAKFESLKKPYRAEQNSNAYSENEPKLNESVEDIDTSDLDLISDDIDESMKAPFRADKNDNAYSENEPKLNEDIDANSIDDVSDEEFKELLNDEEFNENLTEDVSDLDGIISKFENQISSYFDNAPQAAGENGLDEAVAITIGVDEIDDSVVANTPTDTLIVDNADAGMSIITDDTTCPECGEDVIPDVEMEAPVITAEPVDDAVDTTASDEDMLAIANAEEAEESEADVDDTDVDDTDEIDAEPADAEEDEDDDAVEESLKKPYRAKQNDNAYSDYEAKLDEAFDEAEEIDECSINNCISEALSDTYENVDSFETDNVELSPDELKVEGYIKFSNGNKNRTSYSFTESKKNDSGLITLVGTNKTLTSDGKFILKGKISNKSFVSESLSYKYVDKGTKNVVIGTVESK